VFSCNIVVVALPVLEVIWVNRFIIILSKLFLSFLNKVFFWCMFPGWFRSFFLVWFLSLHMFGGSLLLYFFSLILEFMFRFSPFIGHHIILFNYWIIICHTLWLLSVFRFIYHYIFKCILFLLHLWFLKLWSLLLFFVEFILIIIFSTNYIIFWALLVIFLGICLNSICPASSIFRHLSLELSFIIRVLCWIW